jgi:hypothetical protein
LLPYTARKRGEKEEKEGRKGREEERGEADAVVRTHRRRRRHRTSSSPPPVYTARPLFFTASTRHRTVT